MSQPKRNRKLVLGLWGVLIKSRTWSGRSLSIRNNSGSSWIKHPPLLPGLHR
jgi:hypothetical protein